MSFLDAFKGNQYKAELDSLKQEYDSLKALMTPEMQDYENIRKRVDELGKSEAEKTESIKKLSQEIDEINSEIELKKKEIINLNDDIVMQDFGLYRPQFDFANALIYKDKLSEIRSLQKQLIKDKMAVTGKSNWEVNGSKAQGKKLVSDTQKLLLRAFNSECDDIVSRVRYTNFDRSLERINKLGDTISKLGTVMGISITSEYMNAKRKELRLAFEYQQKKEQEKEELKAARAEQREQAKLQKEIDEQRKKLEKEQTHYQSAMEHLNAQLAGNPDNIDLLNKKADYEAMLSEIDKSLSDIDYRQANMKAGYVYIISNIGSFGKDVYKIGMTRRLDPQERVDELGDASVPFNFDVHAMIFSDDAPALETALHHAFADKKLNMVNQRREFFNVTLDEIKKVVQENFDKTVEFIDVPNAEQYRISEKMKHPE